MDTILENKILDLTTQIKNVSTNITDNTEFLTKSFNKFINYIKPLQDNKTDEFNKKLNENILNLTKTVNENTKLTLKNQIETEKNKISNIKQSSLLFNPLGRLDEEISKLTFKTIGSISDSLGKVVGNMGGIKTLSNLSQSHLNILNYQQQARQITTPLDNNIKQQNDIKENNDNLKTITVVETKSYDRLDSIDKTLKDIKDILFVDDAEKELNKQKINKQQDETNVKKDIKEKKKEDETNGPQGSLLKNLIPGATGLGIGAAIAALGYELSKVTKLIEWSTKIPKIGVGIAKGVQLAEAGLSKITKPAATIGKAIASKIPKAAATFTKAAATAGKVVSKVAPVLDIGALAYGTYKGVTMTDEQKQAEIERLAKAQSTIGGAAWEATKTFFNTSQQGKNIMLAGRETGGLVGDIYDIGKKNYQVKQKTIETLLKAAAKYNIPEGEVKRIAQVVNNEERIKEIDNIIKVYNKPKDRLLDSIPSITADELEGVRKSPSIYIPQGQVNIPNRPIIIENKENNKEFIKMIDNRLMKYEDAITKSNLKLLEALEKLYNKEPINTSTYINQNKYPAFNSSAFS